jgi:hypothetical protein
MRADKPRNLATLSDVAALAGVSSLAGESRVTLARVSLNLRETTGPAGLSSDDAAADKLEPCHPNEGPPIVRNLPGAFRGGWGSDR